jgi:hypothetical protein
MANDKKKIQRSAAQRRIFFLRSRRPSMIKRPADIVAPPKSSPIIDTLNRDGAMALAKRLQQYWHDQGYPAARFWTEPLNERFEKIGTYEVYRKRCFRPLEAVA